MSVSKAACAWIAFGAFMLGAMSGCTVGGCSSYADRKPRAGSYGVPSSHMPPPDPIASRPTAAPGARCQEAPARVVSVIDASFTNGEHLEHAQAVSGSRAMTYVGGNIYSADGQRVSSHDTWLVSGGVVYAITSDARRHTLLPDGRDLDPFNWPQYNDEISDCVGIAARAATR